MFTDTDLAELKDNLYRKDGIKVDYIDSFISGDSARDLVARLEAAEKVIESIVLISQIYRRVFMWPDNLDNGPRIALADWKKEAGK